MTLEEIYENYPLLYHMAWDGSYESIKKTGLLSTSRLLDLYQVEEDHRTRLEMCHRPECEEIQRVGLPAAVIRDQKPMSDSGLRRALDGGIKPSEWYRVLNSMVFFWPTKERLLTMLGASTYKDLNHDVIIACTRTLVNDHRDRLRISPINSGCTKPFPHPRSLGTFMTNEEFPFSARKKKVGVSKAVAEICFTGGIENISDYVIDVVSMNVNSAPELLEKY